jgi:hypothetical protein
VTSNGDDVMDAGKIAHLWRQDRREEACDAILDQETAEDAVTVMADVANYLLELGENVAEFATYMVSR